MLATAARGGELYVSRYFFRSVAIATNWATPKAFASRQRPEGLCGLNDVTIQRFNVSALRTFEAALSSRVSLASSLFSAPLHRFNVSPVAPSRHDEVERRRKPYGKGGTIHVTEGLNALLAKTFGV
ncbi:MAG: hypothetical protein DMF46_07455 [Verrucomicrobia bacterium]|nr:MAG: hypothetical protein DMF46_07455 [Verrucomicrobiota bacterium]